jgi:hypothetical protein
MEIKYLAGNFLKYGTAKRILSQGKSAFRIITDLRCFSGSYPFLNSQFNFGISLPVLNKSASQYSGNG